MAEALNVLYSSEKIAGTSASLKILLNYFKSMLRGSNTDKIKLLLDTRATVFLIPYLNIDDIHARASLLEIFLEISTGFENISYSYAHQVSHQQSYWQAGILVNVILFVADT